MLFPEHVKKAIKLALKNSTSDLFKHAAILYDEKGNIISTGCNSSVYCSDAIFGNPYVVWHAEHLALYRAYGHRIRKGNSKVYMLVIRCNKNGELRLSKPCYHCSELIHKHRITKVYYSTSEGGIEEL
jgi:tRNA(Arg) A34 adenosine deaminase TadA